MFSGLSSEKTFLSDKYMTTPSQSFDDIFGNTTEFPDCSDKWWEKEPDIAKICDDFLTYCPEEVEENSCRGTADGINQCICPVSTRFRYYVVFVFLTCFALPGGVITYCYYSFIKQITKVHRLVHAVKEEPDLDLMCHQFNNLHILNRTQEEDKSLLSEEIPQEGQETNKRLRDNTEYPANDNNDKLGGRRRICAAPLEAEQWPRF
ncbi:Oidioi.mRNA.OKI2018_I69.chr1.g3436.t1.cds [Oikopleura dioica]|uniref:Oidioi.mRNA.OKI2018_I69.chr1.g3436.t1.cds n=1 Tax=Oikopleura dioica TaxID=34765 RepID=A0ABN7SZL2_OIKDI|nr:Oidioi.mRNA.OKI2018_I69.chr1.g3436.t1.cds [Oikopleura dioica]